MIALIGFSCMFMAFVLAMTDPLGFRPHPQLQALVWFAFGVWCFVTAWNQRNWRPPTD